MHKNTFKQLQFFATVVSCFMKLGALNVFLLYARRPLHGERSFIHSALNVALL